MTKPALLLILLAACGHDDPATADAGVDAAAPPDASGPCVRTAPAADRVRHVVVSHPYDANGDRSGQYETLDLSATGALSRASHTFAMGRAAFGVIAFTPDGKIGVVAQEDGKLGVFRLADDGTATVVDPDFGGTFYAGRLAMDPSGNTVWVIDGNTTANGGGIYRVDLACDGTPTDRGLVAAGSTPGALAFTGGHALVAAGAMLDSPAGDDVHMLAWGSAAPARVDGADAFGDDKAIIGGAALTADGKTFLVGDTSGFSGVANRVAVVSVGAASVDPISVITPVEDPEAILASPFGNVAIATSAFGNKIFILDTGGTAGAWRTRGEVAYMGGAKPQLPGDAVAILAGSLRGHVLVSENVSVRQLAFRDTGAVDDLGSLTFGDGLEQVAGAIGVTP